MNLNPNTTVRELAAEIPGATRVFEKAGIDYCCGGTRPLADACASAGVTLKEMMSSLELAEASANASDEPDFAAMSPGKLIEHIVQKHHVFTRDEIRRLGFLIEKVYGAHGANHPELEKIRAIFKSLSAELEPHMMKEEMVLFPYIRNMEDAASEGKTLGAPPFGTVVNPVRMMTVEHEAAGYLLQQLRDLSSNYAVPSDACISYSTLYEALEAFEKDLHQHIHLENNILFPRALEMELKP